MRTIADIVKFNASAIKVFEMGDLYECDYYVSVFGQDPEWHDEYFTSDVEFHTLEEVVKYIDFMKADDLVVESVTMFFREKNCQQALLKIDLY